MINTNDMPVLKAILSEVTNSEHVVRVYDPADLIGLELLLDVKSLGFQAMSLGESEYAFSKDGNMQSSVTYTLIGYDNANNPGYAVLIDDAQDYSPALTHLICFFDALYSDTEFDLNRETINVANLLTSIEDGEISEDVVECFNALKEALADEYTIAQFAADVQSDQDLYEVHHYLHRVGFDFSHLAHWLNLSFDEVDDTIVTEAFGLEIPSEDILKAAQDFKGKVNVIADKWKPLYQHRFDTKTSLGDAIVMAVPYEVPTSSSTYCGFFITLNNAIFRLYSGIKMADHANQPGITLSKRIDSDGDWCYDNQIRVKCFNVSTSRAIADLMEEVFPTRPDMAENFGIALFNVVSELGINYGEELSASGQLQLGELDYADYENRFNAVGS